MDWGGGMKNQKIQICRAVAIMAVIATHITIADSLLEIGIRSVVNFAVGLFLFLSGILTDITTTWKRLYKNRLSRVLIPYIIWTAISIWYYHSDIFYQFITGSYFYYVFVYAELVILTPAIQKLIKSKYWEIGFIITPIAILAEYIFCFWGKPIPFPWYLENPFVWFIFYYLGMCLRCKRIKLNFEKKHYILLYPLAVCVQLLESFGWYMFGNMTMAISQIKLSAILTTTVLCIIAYLWIQEGDTTEFKILSKMGDFSFAMYLTHGLLISIAKGVDRWWTFNFVEQFTIILLIDFLIIYIMSMILPAKIHRWVGI